ncbi:MAG: hypothetical protein WC444_00070 [Candidatus Paceibacterota bacterium]
MAKSFSTKKYLSKLFAPQLLSELATKHGTQMFFEINDQTPRKLAVSLMEDSIKALDTEPRLEILKDLSYLASITSAHTASLGKKLFKEQTKKDFEPEIECVSDHDVVLYIFLRHEEIADKLAFLFPFYASKSYISYEAKKVEQLDAEVKLTELTREFTRLANKDDNATEQEMEHLFLNDILYIESKFQGSYDVENKVDAKTGEINRKHVSRKIETVRIAYLPKEETVLIAGNVSKEQKIIFLDTFLRIVCGGGYEEKIEVYNLLPLKNLSLDFTQHNKGTPFIKATIKSVTVSYEEGKKKLRLTLPSSNDHTGMQALKETLGELGLEERFSSFDIVNMTFGFMFQNKEKQDKAVNVSCSISPSRASLCPLFEYERYTKAILKNAGVYEGWKVRQEEK